MKNPWLLLDRDDTIIDDPGYLKDPAQVQFLPGAVEGLVKLFEAGFPLVLITNQSGIGRGYFGFEELAAVHQRLIDTLSAAGVELDGIYVCPHAPDAGCRCRKPGTELAEVASKELGLDLSECLMVGDKESDLLLGRNIGAQLVLQIVSKAQPSPLADGHFQSLSDLADHVLSLDF